MTSQRKYALIWLLLPLLVLRGLVPAGFMIDTSSDGLSMVICSGGVYKTVMVDPQVEHVPASDHGHTSQHGDSICPFAAAATGAPAPSALPMVLDTMSVIGIVGSDVAESHSPFAHAAIVRLLISPNR